MKHLPVKDPGGEAVQVLVDDQWVPGVLYSWRQHDGSDRWEGYVHYTPTPGSTYVAHVDQDRLRPTDTTESHGLHNG